MAPLPAEAESSAGPGGGGPPSNGGVACGRAAKRSILKRANSCSSPAERENLLAPAADGGEPAVATAADPTKMPSNSSSATVADSTANS